VESFAVLLTPHAAPGSPAALRLADPGTVALIVDVLRATTTLTVALRNGAAGVIPAATPEEGAALGRQHPGALLCGERDGRVLPGYDLGNSPFEYAAERVAGRTLVFASTNGSQALLLARGARERVLAAFVNLSAAVERVRGARHALIVCAGKLGRFALEDAVCAGALASRLRALGARPGNAEAELVEALAPGDAAAAHALVQGASHGRYLRRLGPEFARDVEFCAQLDSIPEAYAV